MADYKGTVKCYGCGLSGMQSPRPISGSICYTCQKTLALGNKASSILQIKVDGSLGFITKTLTIKVDDTSLISLV